MQPTRRVVIAAVASGVAVTAITPAEATDGPPAYGARYGTPYGGDRDPHQDS